MKKMDKAKANVQRFKGLSEMNPGSSGEQPWTRERTILQVSIDDDVEAEEVFRCSWRAVEPRRQFMGRQCAT